MRVFVKIILVLLLVVLALTDLGILHYGEKFCVSKFVDAGNAESVQQFIDDHAGTDLKSLEIRAVKVPFTHKKALVIMGSDFSTLIHNIDLNAETTDLNQTALITLYKTASDSVSFKDFTLYLVLFLMICLLPNRKVRKPSYYAQAARRRR